MHSADIRARKTLIRCLSLFKRERTAAATEEVGPGPRGKEVPCFPPEGQVAALEPLTPWYRRIYTRLTPLLEAYQGLTPGGPGSVTQSPGEAPALHAWTLSHCQHWLPAEDILGPGSSLPPKLPPTAWLVPSRGQPLILKACQREGQH